MYSERLKFLRERIGLTQREVADIIGVKRGLYAQYETEYTIMPMKHLNTICNYFNVSLDYIFNFTDNKNYSHYKASIDTKISGLRLKEIRKENKLTQGKLAQSLSVALSLLSEYEHGNFLISTHVLYSVCKKFNISADYLLGKIDSPKYLK